MSETGANDAGVHEEQPMIVDGQQQVPQVAGEAGTGDGAGGDKGKGVAGQHAERSRRLRGFLREVQRYLLIAGLEKGCWGLVAAHFLEGAALDVWELELARHVQPFSGKFHVTTFRQSMRELTGTVFHPGGSALFERAKASGAQLRAGTGSRGLV